MGTGGFFGPPSEFGEIEIGFSVVPSFQRKGFATEIVQAWLKLLLEIQESKELYLEQLRVTLLLTKCLKKLVLSVKP